MVPSMVLVIGIKFFVRPLIFGHYRPEEWFTLIFYRVIIPREKLPGLSQNPYLFGKSSYLF
jgi:hypothetical protein